MLAYKGKEEKARHELIYPVVISCKQNRVGESGDIVYCRIVVADEKSLSL